jgi:hypothetical protein
MTLSRTQGGHRTNVSFQIRDGNASVHRGGVNCIKEWEIYLCIVLDLSFWEKAHMIISKTDL